MRRRTLWGSLWPTPLLVGICMVLSVSSYAPVSASQLAVWTWELPTYVTGFEFTISQFRAENPGVTVELQGQAGTQQQVMEKLILAIVAGAPPDMSFIVGSEALELAAKGLVMDVTRAVDGLRFAPADTQEMTLGGKMWGVPYATSVRGLIKRTDLLEEAGLNPRVDPLSMDELYAWNVKLTKRAPDGTYTQVGFVPWTGNWGAPGWIWTFGGKLLDIDGMVVKPTATYKANVEAFAWLRSWGEFYGTTSPATGGLRNGRVAMSAESSSDAATLLAAEIPIATGKVPHPPGGQNGTWGGGAAVVVPINARNPELALKLARFFGESRIQTERWNRQPSALPSAWQSLLAAGRQLPKEIGPLLEQFPEARPRTPLWVEYFLNQLTPAMNAVVGGRKTPEQALHDVQLVMEDRFRSVFGQ